MKRSSPARIGAVSSGILIVVALIASSGCSLFTPGVDLVGSGGLRFSDDQVPRETEYISIGTPGHKQYRVFNENTRPLQAEAENVARAFCERKGRDWNLLQITTYRKPPTRLFTRSAVEIFFECLEKPNASGPQPQVDPR
jgi:hypothetical protein